MEVPRAVTVRVRPGSVAKATKLAQVAGAKRWAWNKRKERHRERWARYKAGQGAKPSVTHYSLRNDFSALRQEVPWLRDLPSGPIRTWRHGRQSSLGNVNRCKRIAMLLAN